VIPAAPVLDSELAAVRAELARVDAKCSTLAALAGAAAAYTAGQASHGPAAVRGVLVAAGAVFTAAVLVLLLTVLRPRLGSAGFCRWAGLSACEIGSRATQLDDALAIGGIPAMEAARAAREHTAHTLQTLSVITLTKYQRLRLAVDLAAVGVLLLAATGIAGAVAP
jgi:hypothetical protein